MTITRTFAAFAAAALLTACASRGDVMTAGASMELGPDGRGEFHAHVPEGGTGELHLVNRGPGRVGWVVRVEGGEQLANGDTLTGATVRLPAATRPLHVVAVVETWKDAGADVDADLSVKGAIRGAALGTKVTR